MHDMKIEKEEKGIFFNSLSFIIMNIILPLKWKGEEIKLCVLLCSPVRMFIESKESVIHSWDLSHRNRDIILRCKAI